MLLIRDVNPGSEFFPIQDPNVFHTRSRIRIKEPKKIAYKLSDIWSGSLIPDLDPDFFTHLGSRGSKKARIPDLGSGSATLALIQNQSLLFCSHVPRISALLVPGIDTHFLTLIACLIWKFWFLFLPKVRASVEASLLSIPLPSFNLTEENAG